MMCAESKYTVVAPRTATLGNRWVEVERKQHEHPELSWLVGLPVDR